MKFALNGALTIGTLDGANVEIRHEVGADNFFLFGLDTERVNALRARGYRPGEYLERSPVLKEAVSLIESGFFSYGENDRFRPIVDNLRHHDPRYMICADFDSFVACEASAAQLYRDPAAWARCSVLNIAGASHFTSSDDTIRAYATDIWGIEPLKVDLRLLGDASPT